MIRLKKKQPEQEKPFLKPIILGRPDITQDEIDAVASVLRSGWISTGSVVSEFEKAFEKFIGEGYAVALSSCTDALRLSMIVSSVGKGKPEVITTPLTFAATVNAIISVGGTPVLCDVTSSGHMDPAAMQRAITPMTRAIMPIHYTGQACDMDRIMSIAERYDLKVIEDAAHAFDGWHVGPMSVDKPGLRRRIGTIGDFTCFSFYANKNITCAEGGMVMCRSKELAERIKTVSMQGLSSGAWRRYHPGPIQRYEVTYAGQKANLSDVHAAIGLTQLRRWPDMKAKREAVWNVYEAAFGLKSPGHAKHLFTIRHPKRDNLRQFLQEKDIGTGIHFKPLHLEPAYAYLKYKKGDFPMAERIGNETISLPVSNVMIVDEANRVVSAIKEFNGEGEKK